MPNSFFDTWVQRTRWSTAVACLALGALVACAPVQTDPDDVAAPTSTQAIQSLDNRVGPAVTREADEKTPQAPPESTLEIDADYKIAPEDLLEIEVFGVPELARTVRVNSSGHISLPLIGMFKVSGLTATQAEDLIEEKYGADYLQDPQVSVFIKEFTTQRITVDGAVVKPGIYPLTGQITLLRALALAGGGSQLADLEEVMLFRLGEQGQMLAERHDVMKIRVGEAPDPLLQNDDMVVVNRNKSRVLLRDSPLRDFVDFINPFSTSVYRINQAN